MLCYIDAFAGMGKITVSNEDKDGSPLIALKYNFNKYIFIEQNEEYANHLKKYLKNHPKNEIIEVVTGDCNDFLKKYMDGFGSNWRGVIFLDPYAMTLKWSSLEIISKTRKFDVWYLFPTSALIRCMPNNKIPNDSLSNKITQLLGTDEWRSCLYQDTAPDLFGEVGIERSNADKVFDYISKRLESIFPTVSKKTLSLKNTCNSEIFRLFFAISNPSKPAKKLSLKGADHILNNTGIER